MTDRRGKEGRRWALRTSLRDFSHEEDRTELITIFVPVKAEQQVFSKEPVALPPYAAKRAITRTVGEVTVQQLRQKEYC